MAAGSVRGRAPSSHCAAVAMPSSSNISGRPLAGRG
jgi:hypothetical protein